MESDSTAPFSPRGPEDPQLSHAALQAAWDKLYKARSILEAEQAHVRDDRIAIQGAIEELEQREAAIAARELRVRQIEMQMALDLEEKQDEEEAKSGLSKLTSAPFDIARSVFGKKK